MDKNSSIPRWTFLLTGLLLSLAPPAHAGESGEIRLDYKRESVRRPAAAARPPVKALPEELSIEMKGEAAEATPVPEKRSGGVVSGEPLYYGKLSGEAREAAAWAVRELVEGPGRRQAFAMGFHDGLHTATDDPLLGRWDYRDGLERGHRSRDAERRGWDLGYEAARGKADEAAQAQVSAEFHDLSREPRPYPHMPAPPLTVDLYEAPPPRLEEVFHDHPLGGWVAAARVGEVDPWRSYKAGSRHAFYDGGWWDAGRALGLWTKDHRNFWRDSSEVERTYFERVFRGEYRRLISPAYARVAEAAYRLGFERGWDYGAEVVYDWSYRQGYHEGWQAALRDSAESAYRRSFPDLYAERYGAYFDAWSTSARPEIRRVELFEDNGDGVFEPGEPIWVDYEIVNYGGAPGRFDVRLDGDVLARGAGDLVDVPRRVIRGSLHPLESAIDASVAPHTASELALTVAGLERRLPLRVSYPLELVGRTRLVDHDSLAGRAVIEATVKNASRRPVSGEVVMRSAELARQPASRDLGELGAGESGRVSFELAGLHPLDLLGGEVGVELEVWSRGRRHDGLDDRLPALALDLGDRDLVVFMTGLARRGARPPAPQDVRRAQELMLRRLEADWRAVAADNGNGYKKDLKERTRSTALGDLVWTYRAERATLARPEVFTALAPRIERLVKDMPGTHPFLRKAARKLARQLEG